MLKTGLMNVPGSYVSQRRKTWFTHFICNELWAFVAAVTAESTVQAQRAAEEAVEVRVGRRASEKGGER